MKICRLLPVLLSLTLVWGCKRTLEVDPMEYSYYPSEAGRRRDYAVDSTYYTTDSTLFAQYYKRELYSGQETDLTNRAISKIEIYTAPKEPLNEPYQDRFQYLQMWSQYQDSFQAERIEGNTKYIVLSYPIVINRRWNGNQMNNLGTERYQYKNIDTTVTLNGKTFEHCIYIVQRSNKSLISDIFTYEIYAPGVGKIERYDRYIKYLSKNGVVKIDTDSYLYHETILDHNF